MQGSEDSQEEREIELLLPLLGKGRCFINCRGFCSRKYRGTSVCSLLYNKIAQSQLGVGKSDFKDIMTYNL